jgi:hypothetical protein
VLTKKSAWNIYTALLVLSLFALLLACLFLFLELKEYGGWGAVKGPVGAAVSTTLRLVAGFLA